MNKILLVLLLLVGVSLGQYNNGLFGTTTTPAATDTLLSADSLSSRIVSFNWKGQFGALTVYGQLKALEGTGGDLVTVKFKPGYDYIHPASVQTLGTITTPASGDSVYFDFSVTALNYWRLMKKYQVTFVNAGTDSMRFVDTKELRK